jgi:hypothetical protein
MLLPYFYYDIIIFILFHNVLESLYRFLVMEIVRIPMIQYYTMWTILSFVLNRQSYCKISILYITMASFNNNTIISMIVFTSNYLFFIFHGTLLLQSKYKVIDYLEVLDENLKSWVFNITRAAFNNNTYISMIGFRY